MISMGFSCNFSLTVNQSIDSHRFEVLLDTNFYQQTLKGLLASLDAEMSMGLGHGLSLSIYIYIYAYDIMYSIRIYIYIYMI